MSGNRERWLVALDLDGTLFGDDLVISPRVRQAITTARAAGHLVTLATGRGFSLAAPIALELGIDDALITFQGAVLGDRWEVLWEQPLAVEIARPVIQFAAERELPLHVYVAGRVFSDRERPQTLFYRSMHPGEDVEFVGPLDRFLTVPPIKLLLILDPAESDSTAEQLQALLGADAVVVRSHPRFVEVTHRDVNKGRALLALAARAGIPRDRTMAIGDNLNDVPMIEAAGVGVAMGNAGPAVKAVADWVAPPVEGDGAAVAIERFVPTGGSQGPASRLAGLGEKQTDPATGCPFRLSTVPRAGSAKRSTVAGGTASQQLRHPPDPLSVPQERREE